MSDHRKPLPFKSVGEDIERINGLVPSCAAAKNAPLKVLCGSIILNSLWFAREQGKILADKNGTTLEDEALTVFRKMLGKNVLMPDPHIGRLVADKLEWSGNTVFAQYTTHEEMVVAGATERRSVVSVATIHASLIVDIMEEHDHASFVETYRVPESLTPTAEQKEILRQKTMREHPERYRSRPARAAFMHDYRSGGGMMIHDHDLPFMIMDLADRVARLDNERDGSFMDLIAERKVKLVPNGDGSFTLEIEGLAEKHAERLRVEAEAQNAVDTFTRLKKFEEWYVSESKVMEDWMQTYAVNTDVQKVMENLGVGDGA